MIFMLDVLLVLIKPEHFKAMTHHQAHDRSHGWGWRIYAFIILIEICMLEHTLSEFVNAIKTRENNNNQKGNQLVVGYSPRPK